MGYTECKYSALSHTKWLQMNSTGRPGSLPHTEGEQRPQRQTPVRSYESRKTRAGNSVFSETSLQR